MKKIHIKLIKQACLRFATNHEMQIKKFDDVTFIAEDEIGIVNVPIKHVYDLVCSGWTVDEVLNNEMNYKGGS